MAARRTGQQTKRIVHQGSKAAMPVVGMGREWLTRLMLVSRDVAVAHKLCKLGSQDLPALSPMTLPSPSLPTVQPGDLSASYPLPTEKVCSTIALSPPSPRPPSFPDHEDKPGSVTGHIPRQTLSSGSQTNHQSSCGSGSAVTG